MKDTNAESTIISAVRAGQFGGDKGRIYDKRQLDEIAVAEVGRAHRRRVEDDTGILDQETVDRAPPHS